MQLTQQNPVQQFIQCLDASSSSLIEAGKIAAAAIDADESFIERVCAARSGFTPEFIKRIADVGRQRLHPSLVFGHSIGESRLRKLPYTLQEKHVTDPVPLVVLSGNGCEVIQADVRNLTPAQAAQVFAYDRIRSEAEQRAYLEDARVYAAKPAKPVRMDEPYRIVGKNVVVLEQTQLTIPQLQGLVAQLGYQMVKLPRNRA